MDEKQHYSAELLRFLGEDEGADFEDVSHGPNPFLGEQLDITTSQSRLEGVTQELERFKDHEVLRAILEGSDPKEFGRQYEGKLRQAELESIQDYITESDNLVQLHAEIRACDDILASMEELLGNFQSNLGSISSEIRSLQEHSQTMSVKLRNRKATQEKIGAFIEHVSVPASLVNTIMQSDVDDTFLAALETLSSKLLFCATDSQAKTSAALKDVSPELERLRVKAAAKCRDFLMQKIFGLRKDKTNIQILQQNVLLKYKDSVKFLRNHGKEVFDEVRAAYVDTLSRVLSSKFKAYITAIEKLQVADVASAADLVGNPDVTPGAIMSMFGRGSSTHHKADIFALGNRASVLLQLDAPALIPHIEESKGDKFHFEVLFRSLHKLAMDTGTTEYLFCNQFFPNDTSVFNEVLQPTLQVLQMHLETFLQETHDMLTVLLMIRINSAHSNMMGRRKIQCLDDYLDRLKLLLWPKMKSMFDGQLESIRTFNTSQHQWTELKVHYTTERYGHLTASMLTLNSDGKDSPLDTNIERMKTSMIELLLRLSRAFAKKKHVTIFLLLNFSYILAVLQEAAQRVKGGFTGPTPTHVTYPLGEVAQIIIKEYEDQVTTCTNMYVEEVLTTHFGRLVAFVKKAETAQKMAGGGDSSPVPVYGPAEAAPVVKDFTTKWSNGMDALHKEVMKDFASAASCGREVLKAAMTQLLLYYTRLLEMLKRSGPEGQALVRDAVTVPSIMYDIRRYNKG